MADVYLISDDLTRAEKLRAKLAFNFWIEIAPIDTLPDGVNEGDCILLIDCDLGEKASAEPLKALMERVPSPDKSIVLVDGSGFIGQARGNALGGGQIFSRGIKIATLSYALDTMLHDIRPLPQNGTSPEVRRVLDQARRLHQDIALAVHDNKALPKKAIETVLRKLVDVLAFHGIGSWIDAVRLHHSHTYRHSMLVTGYAVVFGQQMALDAADIDLLAIAALLHDVGKVRIPLSVLDKPGKLTSEEFDLIKNHPIYSRDILVDDGQFAPAVINAAYQHHEFIDGSGYPEGLKGDQIAPLVRMLTIADIYAALTEVRSYKRAYSNREAFHIMTEMVGKLDSRLLNAFRPIVLDETFGRVRRRKAANAQQDRPVLQAGIHPLDRNRTVAM
ncbi:HD-GYP domain-containing protein [Breoghania sp. L-A4]|nr:HD-GYP domain-containing protein [Breoghania sp. L-A4]